MTPSSFGMKKKNICDFILNESSMHIFHFIKKKKKRKIAF